MEPRQVFRAYDETDGPALPAAFCLQCGGAMADRDVGGRTRRACASCGFIHYPGPAAGVAVLVAEGDRVLLGRRRPDAFEGGKWCLPCGYVEYDEDYLTAALREVAEETGLAVEITGIISVCSNFLAPNVHTVVTVLAARPAGGALSPGDDIEDVRWFATGEALPELAFESDRHIIERYFAARIAGAPVDPRFAAPG